MQGKLSGCIILDKPEGMSSARLVAKVKSITRAKKAGHTGTLDPFATGVMICCLNRATRLARFLLESSKTYEAVLRLGIETDTQDSTGNVVSRKVVENLTADGIRQVFSSFEGEIEQIPPVYSALKHKGVPLYKLARIGKAVQKPPRTVQIHNITVTRIEMPMVWFTVKCSSGTYIRTLCVDIGRRLGSCGHLQTLKRTAAGGFELQDAVSIEQLESAVSSKKLKDYLVPMAEVLSKMPTFVAEPRMVEKIRCGQSIFTDDMPQASHVGKQHYIRIVDNSEQLIAVVHREVGESRYDYCCVFPDEEAE